MGFLSSLLGGAASLIPGVGPIVGPLVGGLASAIGGGQASNTQDAAAQRAAQMAQFTPYNVHTGYGNSTFDTTNHTAGVTLSPQYQQLHDQLTGGAANLFSNYNTFNPQAAATTYKGFLDQLAQPNEHLAQTNLENRLFSQGMLGSTGGALRTQALDTSQALANDQRALQSEQYGQQYQQNLLGQGMQALQGASGIDQSALQALNLGSSMGGRSAAAGAQAAQFPWQAAQNASDAQAALWGNLGTGLSNGINSYFNPSTSTPSLSQTHYLGTLFGNTYNTNPMSQQSSMLAQQDAGLFS